MSENKLVQRTNKIIAANKVGGSETDDQYVALSRLIATRVLGVKPEDQDLELDDHDWLLIIDALSHKALTRAEMNGDGTAAGPDMAAALKLSYQHILGSDPEVTSGGIKNTDLREIIATALGFGEGIKVPNFSVFPVDPEMLAALKIALPQLEDNARFLREIQAHAGKVVGAFDAVKAVKDAIAKAEGQS